MLTNLKFEHYLNAPSTRTYTKTITIVKELILNTPCTHLAIWNGSKFLIGFGLIFLTAGLLIAWHNNWFLHNNYEHLFSTALFFLPGLTMASYWRSLGLQNQQLRIRTRFLFLFIKDQWIPLKHYAYITPQIQQFHRDHEYPHDRTTQGIGVYLISNTGHEKFALSDYKTRTWLVNAKGLQAAMVFAEHLSGITKIRIQRNFSLENRIAEKSAASR